jgi:hypothetical protein
MAGNLKGLAIQLAGIAKATINTIPQAFQIIEISETQAPRTSRQAKPRANLIVLDFFRS